MAAPPRVGFWMRLIAAAIDVFAFFFVYISGFAFVQVATRSQMQWLESLLGPCVWLLYMLSEVLLAASPGKLILGLRIACVDAAPADFWRKFLRYSTKHFGVMLLLAYILTGFVGFYFISGIVNFFICVGFLFASNDDKQAWHDQWSGTAVYRSRDLLTDSAFPLVGPPPPL